MKASPSKARRVVIKLGTGILTSGIGKIDSDRISSVCAQIETLRAAGTEVLLVSSGAVGLGMGALKLDRRPKDLARLQACAAVGQSKLIQLWQQGFAPLGITVAQILLTHEDLRIRKRYLAVKETIGHLLDRGIVPIINENDTVSAEEIKFGDNDILSAMVASLAEAQYLFILSTAPGLVDLNGTGQILPVVTKITPEIEAMAGGTTSATAVGGMVSKLTAVKLAGKAGCGVFIANGAEPDIVNRLLTGQGIGTFFVPAGLPMESKKRWLAYFQRPKVAVHVDQGALEAISSNGGSLLASGVTGHTGTFEAGDIVNLAAPDGLIFARGQTRFSSEELVRIEGKGSEELKELYPSRRRLEVIHRDALVVL